MNIAKLIESGGYVEVPNPNYNPRAKKNKQPKTIKVLSGNQEVDDAVMLGREGEENKWSVDAGSIQKYRDYGINYTPQAAASGSLDKQLADAQGTFTKVGNSIAQAVVSELALGIPKGFTDLIDVVGQAVGLSDKDYTNPVSAKLEEWQEKFRNEVAPIYTTPGVDISNGGFSDVGWWASQFPSIITSLTLLLPSSGITRLIGKVASGIAKGVKATNTARKVASSTAKWAKRAEEAGKHRNIRGIMDWAAKPSVQAKAARAYDIGMTAALSRTVENYQEARQTYNDMYADASKALAEMSPEEYAAFLERNKETIGEDIDTNDKDAVAKKVAAESADKTFLWDYSNIVFDIIELYGLKNMAKGLRNGQTRASVRRAHKESIKTAGMTETEKEAYQASKTFRQKAAEKIEDWTIGSRTAIGAQLSEGIEEGVNYVAQQEGMNLGHVMLGRDGEGSVVKDSSFSDRFFNDYIKNPQLYESAFWGVFGGIAFQGLASGFYRAQNAIELRNEYKKKEKYAKEHSKTDETITAPKAPSWKELWLMPEIKRRKADIEAREKHLNEYLNEADMILHRGLNPYQKDQDGQNVAISDRDKEVLLNKAYKKFVTNMALNAMDSGNFDMFKEYIGSNEVKEAIKNHLSAGLEDGTLDAETKNSRKAIIDNMDNTQQSVLSLVDKIEKQYDDNIVALNRAAARINREDIINRISRKRGKKDIVEKIPLEYLQIIARENIDKQLDIEDLEGEINSAEQLAADQETWIAKNKGKNYDFQAYRNAVRLQFLTRQLAEARAEKNELIKDKERLDTVVGQEELTYYDKYIKNLQDIIYNLDAENGASNLLFAIEQSLALEKDKNTGTFVGNPVNLDYLNFRDKIISLETEEDAAKIKEIDDYLVSFDERLAGAASNKGALHQKKVVEDMVRAGFDKNTGIDAVSKDLHETYFRLADLQLAIAQNRQQIYITDEEIADRAAEIHNGLNEARKQGIQKSKETIFNLADKYGSDAVRQAIYDRLFNKVPEGTNALIGDETLTEEEQTQRNTDLTTLHEALDYLHLEADANKSIITQVDWILSLRDDVRAAQRESSSTNQNRNLDEENSGEGSTSQTQSQTPTQPQNGQNGNQQPQQPTQQPQPQQPTTSPKATTTDTLEDENGAYAKLITNNNTNGEERELQITDTKHPEAVALLNDDEMFAKNGVSLTEDFVITKNPIVIRKSDGSFEVVEAGEIAKPTQNNINQANQIAAGNEEVQEEVVDEEEIEEPPVKETTEETTEESANEETPKEKAKYNAGGAGETRFSSTGGEQSNSPFDEYGNRTKRDPLDIISEEINAKAIKAVATAVGKGYDMDFNALQEELIRDYVKDSTNEEAIRTYIDRAIKFTKTLYSRKTGKPVDGATTTTTNPEGAAAVDDLIVMSSQLKESRTKPSKTVADKLFESVEKLVKKYAKDSSCDILTITNEDGTSHKLYCINLEDLFRYCREVTDSEQAANLLAENLIYVMNKNKDKYFLIDGNTPLEVAIENSFKSTKDRITSITTSNKSYGINILGAISRLRSLNLTHEIQVIYDILDNIKPGDKIQYSKNPDYPNQIVFSVNGTMIGVLPVPIVDANTGGVYQYNDGWKTDILDNGDGTISSNLKQLFKTWLLNSEKSDSITKLNDIILRMAFTNPKGEELKALLKEFAENEEIIKAKAEGFTDGTSSDETLLNGLSKLWAYTREIAGLTTDETNELRATTLDSWFDDEVASSFALVQKLNNNESGEVELAYISEGELIRVDIDKTLPVSKGIGSQHREHIKLGAAKSRGVITISGDIGGQRELPFSSAANAVGRGGTFVVIPARNGQHQYVQAFARPINSITTGSVANIIKAIHREFNNIEQIENVEKRGIALEKLVRQLFSRDNNSPLFTIGRKYKIGDFINIHTGEKLGFTIEFVDDSGKKHTATVTWKGVNKVRTYNRKGLVLHIDGETKKTESTKTGKTIVDEVNNNVADRLFDVLNSNSKFSIGFDFIDSDNNLGTTLRGVVSRNSEGKFVITIPNSRDASNSETFEFDSFSSFMLDNDLITVRTKPDAKGSNFKKTFGGNNNRARQQVKIKEVDSTTPVEESSATKQVSKQVSKTTVESVLDILTSDSTEKGWQIGKIILKSKARQKATLPNITAFIFPENLIFANENIGDTAITNIGKKPVTVGNTVVQPGQVVVGNEWINMLRRDRNQAVRKLIHEQLHQILHTNGNERYIEQIREIFDEFARKNTNPELEKYLYKWNEARYYTDGKLNEEGLEEFLVETLTSKELADALNNMTADNPIERKEATSILQKLMDVLAKMLGFDIKKGSVYEKEFMLLRDIMSEDNNANTTNNVNETITNEQTEQEEQPVQLELNFTETPEETIERHNDTNENASIESVNNYEIEDVDEDEDKRNSVITENTPLYETVEDEMQSIKEQAIANGTFMKAPNGKPTNLTERQWLQVRTKAFKDWFGDWENNPSEASKVVDDNGEPLVVYHGSPNYGFNIFDLRVSDRFSETTKKINKKFYFTVNKTVAKQFALNDEELEELHYAGSEDYIPTGVEVTDTNLNNRVYSVFLNIREPYIIDAKNKHLNALNEKDLNDMNNANGIIVNNILESLPPRILEMMPNADDYLTNTITTDYIVSNPNQIKSATDNVGTFSAESDDIRYSTLQEDTHEVLLDTTVTLQVPTVSNFINRLPLDVQTETREKINNGEIQVICR